MRRRFGTVAAVVVACALAQAPPLQGAARPLEYQDGAVTAHVVAPTVARRAPDRRGVPVYGVSGLTAFSKRPQALLVTGRRTGHDGRRWVQVQLPIRPNGSVAWVPARAVSLSVTRVRVVVHRSARVLEVWRGGRRLHRWPAGVGRPGTPTPLGVFGVQDPMRTLPGWRGVYGEWTIALNAHSEVLRSFMGGDGLVAIHGGSLGRVGRPSSNGCVILAPAHLRALARLVRPGTPVHVLR